MIKLQPQQQVQQKTQQDNILFYSNQCKDCHNLIILLKNQFLLQNFKMMCVDNIIDEVKAKGITKVPTLIVAGIPELLVGKAIDKWLEAIIAWRVQQRTVLQKKMIENQKIVQNNILAIRQQQIANAGPLGFMDKEMTGFSDSFAYVKEDITQPHTFAPMVTTSGSEIYTAPEDKKKISERIQEDKISDLKQKRTEQEKFYKGQMSQQQKMILDSATKK